MDERHWIIKLDQIPPEGLSLQVVFEPEWFGLPPKADDPIRPIRLLEPVLADFFLERAGSDVRLGVEIGTCIRMTCARCLDPVHLRVKTQARLTFCRVTAGQMSLERELELTLDDLESAPLEGDEIDLWPPVYEQIVLSLPMKPLCHEDCRGLCPSCGANRNRELCSCSGRMVDPRWERLRSLKIGG